MENLKQFKDFGIKITSSAFVGDKVSADWVLNKKITVHDFKIENSKFHENKKCLYLQVSIEGKKHVLFSGYSSLMETIQQVPKNEFPFEVTIIKEDKKLQFT